MSMQPRDPAADVVDEAAETYCYGHPKTPTKLRCSRCDRPICGRCAIPASVGQHCPECVAEARKSAPRVRSAATATAPVIIGIIAVTAVSFLAQQMLGRDYTNRLSSLPIGLINGELVGIAVGEWYRLITPVLVHAGALHFGMNMFVLYIYGQNVEEAFGHVRFFVIYIVTGVVASAFSYAFGSGEASVGASGAVMGVIGALLVYLYNRRSSQFIAQHLRGIVGFLVLNTVIGFAIPGIDVMAHLGGFVGGVLLGLGFDRQGAGAHARSPIGLQIFTTAALVAGTIALVVTKTNTLT
jgi:membrane associated rhomboid family serine protease